MFVCANALNRTNICTCNWLFQEVTPLVDALSPTRKSTTKQKNERQRERYRTKSNRRREATAASKWILVDAPAENDTHQTISKTSDMRR